MAKEATGDATAKDSQTGDVQATGGGNPGTPAAGASATTPAETPASSKGDDKLAGPPMGVLNRRSAPIIRRTLDTDFTTIWGQIAAVTEEVFKDSSDLNSGPYRAICLTGPDYYPNGGKATAEDYDPADSGHLRFIFGEGEKGLSATELIQIRARIPRLHQHLPVPIDTKDWAAISQYPVFTATSQNTNNGKVPEPGEIVVVDFGDRVNKTDGIFIESMKETQPRAGKAGQSDCPPPSAPASMGKPAQGGAAPVDLGTQGPIGSRLKAQQPGQKAFIFGDSQCQGAMGRHISKYLKDEMGYDLIVPDAAFGNKKFKAGGGRTWARHGSKASEWATAGPSANDEESYKKFRKGLWHMLEPCLKQKPALVAIIGGGNGAKPGDAKAIIEKVRSVAGNCAIAWFSAPLAVPTKTKKPLGGDKRWNGSVNNWTPKASYVASRQKTINLIGGEVKNMSNAVFINTPAMSPQYHKVGCGSCDGVHVPNGGAEEMVKNIKAAGSPTPGGENLDYLNSMKNKLAGLATGFKKTLKDLGALLAQMETKLGQMTKEQADANIKQYAERLGTTKEDILNRDFYSGYQPAADGFANKKGWAPPTYFEMAKYYGFQSPNKDALADNIVEMESTLVDLLDGEDEFAKKWAEEHYSKEVEKAKKLWEEMGDVNMSLPGEPFPTDGDEIKALQIDMALKADVAQKKIKAPAPPAPADTSASSGGSQPPNCGNGYGGSGGGGTGGGSVGPLPEVDIGNLSFKAGELTTEEVVAIFMGYGKKFGYTKYELCILAGILRNEAGALTKKKARTGNKCSARLEPHVSARRIVKAGQSCSWQCCAAKKLGVEACADGTKGYHCKGDGKFPGCGWSGIKKCASLHGSITYKCLTPGIAQAFYNPAWGKYEGAPLGKNAEEYVGIVRASHAAQIFAIFAFIEEKKVLRKAIKTRNIPAVARFYNGAKSTGGQLSPYGARLEIYMRGLDLWGGAKYYNQKTKKILDNDWFITKPPTNKAAEAAAHAMELTYSLPESEFKPLPKLATDIILEQYDSFTPKGA